MLPLLLHLPPVALLIAQARDQLLRLPLPGGVRLAHLSRIDSFNNYANILADGQFHCMSAFSSSC